MPKINAQGAATYAGHTGVVTNAVGEQFELDPTKQLDGSDNPGLTRDENADDPIAVDGTPGVPSAGTDARDRADSDADLVNRPAADDEDADANKRDADKRDADKATEEQASMFAPKPAKRTGSTSTSTVKK